MSAHEHHFAKLNDEAVFCRGCGDIKTAPLPCTRLHYPHWTPTFIYSMPAYTTYPQWQTITSGSATGSSITSGGF